MLAFFKPTPIKLVFLLEWLLYLPFALWMGYLSEASRLLPILFGVLFYYLVACLLVALLERRRPRLLLSRLLALALGLAGLDQLIKLGVYRLLPLETSIPLLPGILNLQQARNLDHSWLMSVFQWRFIGQAGLALLSLLGLGLGILIYRYYVSSRRESPWAALSWVLFSAGLLSALCDQTLWGFTLDYLQLPGHFVADGKDLYLSFGLGALLAEIVHTRSFSLSLDLPGAARELRSFLRFVRDDLRKILRA